MHSDIKAFFSKPLVFKIFFVCLVILAVWQVTMGIISLLHLYSETSPTLPAVVKSVKQPSTPTVTTSPLFGDYVPENIEDANIKKSMLNLIIVGVIYAENEENSQVLIRLANGHENVYQVGDRLPGGGTIKRITPYGVVVIRNSTLESLSLPKDELIFAPPSNQSLFEE